MSFDPVQTVEAVDKGAEAIELAADAAADALRRAEVAEHAYQRAVQIELIKIYHEAKEAGERMPAEDVRLALAHDRLPEGLYKTHLTTKAEVAASEKVLKGILASVSARQSVLKALGGVA